MKKHLLSFFVMILISTTMFGDELTNGYQSFINNNYKQAYQHFTAATQQSETKAEAYLMLSLMATVDQDQRQGFIYFMEFCKSSTNPDPYITALFHHQLFLGYSASKSKEQINWYFEQLKRSDLNSTLKAYILEDVGKYYESLHDIKKSREYLSKLGAVMDWQITGDFDNISASGFDKDFGPLNHPEANAVFKNKMNADVRWFDLYKQVPGKWIDFTNNFYCNNTLVFAQSFCNSPDDRTVHLRIGTSGSLKVWVNDQLLFIEEEERNNGIDNYVLPVKLSKGNNRILLQIGCSKIQQCNFMMRVTDISGNLPTDLTFSKNYSPYNLTKQEKPGLITLPAEVYLTEQIKKFPDKLVNYLALANTYLSNDKTHDAMNVLLMAQKIAPNCSSILNQLYELYIRDQDRTSTSLIAEKLKVVDPDKPFVLNMRINDAFNAENYKEVRQLLERKEMLYGRNKELLLYKLNLAGQENKLDEFEPILKELTDNYSDDYQVVSQKYQFEKNYKQNQKAAIKTLKDFTKKYYDREAMQNLSDELFQAGQIKEGLEILKKLSDYNPFNDSFYKQLGLYYLQSGNNELAKQYLSECLLIAPYYGPYHGNLAKVYINTGQTDMAIGELKADIAYSPSDYEAIRKLREIQSKKDVFEYFPTKDYYKMYENSPTVSDYPSDNFLSLAEERQVVLYENGGCEIRQIILLKALTLKGIDYLKEYNIGYFSNEDFTIEKAEVLKKNGNRLQAEVNENQVVYTALEPGDAVFLIYRKDREVSGQMSKQFYEKALLNSWYPSLNIEYNLLVDKNVRFNYTLGNSDLQPEISEVDDFKLYTWKRTSKKALLLESYMPVLVDACELLKVSTIPNWDYISKWYFDISNTKCKPEIEVMQTVNQLLEGKGKLSEYETAAIFYNFIEENIRYSSVSFRQNGIVPQKASDVLITRIGDCKDLSVLFTSMCKVAGIHAEIVLVNRRQNGTRWMDLPTFDFDHAIAKAILDGKEYYIELTSSYYPFAALGEGLLGSVVLDINNDTSITMEPKVLNPPTRQPNNNYRVSKVLFNDDNMTCDVSNSCTGSLAANKRAMYRDLGKEERENKFLKAITVNYSNIKLRNLEFSPSLGDCRDTLNYTYSYTAPKVFTKINDMYIVKLPITDKLSPMDFLSSEQRHYPIESWRYSTSDTIAENLTIIIPEGKKLVEVPKSVSYTCNQADYSISFKGVGNELQVIRTLIYKKDYVPVADYAEYRSFIEMVVNADTQQIAFK